MEALSTGPRSPLSIEQSPPYDDAVTTEDTTTDRSTLVDLLARYRRVAAARSYDESRQLSLPRVTDASRADAEILAAAGRPHDAVRTLGHDEAVAELRRLGTQWSVAEAASVWVAGLWSAPWAWRPALTGTLLASRLPDHPFTPYGGDTAGGAHSVDGRSPAPDPIYASTPSTSPCRVCGTQGTTDVAVTDAWSMRHLDGAPIDGDVVGHVLALNELEGHERPVPTEHDLWTFRAILTVLRTLPQGTSQSKARAALKQAHLLDTVAPYAVGSVLEELALVGVVATASRPGLAERWSDYSERDERPSVRVEVQAPLAWWSSSDGLRDHVLREVFEGLLPPETLSTDVDLDSPHPTPVPARGATVAAAARARERALSRPATTSVPRSVGSGPAAAGDVWAMRVAPDAWVTLYVWSVEELGGRPYARVEFLAGLSSAFPSPAQRAEVQPRYDGRWWFFAHSLDKTPGTRRILQDAPAPTVTSPDPDRTSNGAAKNLGHLARACFPELH